DTDFLNGKFKKLIDEANEKPTGLIRIFNESGDGELDFKLQLDEDTLYYNGDVLYNPNEAGNFLWTYFLESHGFHFLHSILAQGGSLKGKDRFDEWHDTKARWSGFAYYWKNRIKKR
ncbi:MAG: hypothetical protein IJM03_00030, partial [Treponema sp.]|nr:hypothetical protein [Treponema sp.]